MKKKKTNLKFYSHTSSWFFKRFYEDLKDALSGLRVKNGEKCFLFDRKSSFRFQDI